MTMIGIALMSFSLVLLIISVYYINTTTRHKERMALIEQGKDVKEIFDKRAVLEVLKGAYMALATGIGFFTGVWLESAEIFDAGIELPLYFAPITLFVGISLLLFYKLHGSEYLTGD